MNRSYLTVVASLLLALLVGCASDGGASSSGNAATTGVVPPPAPTVVNPNLPPKPEVVSKVAGNPVPPAGAQWTIFCTVYDGPNHVLESNQLKQDLLSQTKLRDWYLVHHDDNSILYYGYYQNLESPRAKSDRLAVANILVAGGDKAFPKAQFVPLSSPDPVAPAEWNLANLPPDKYWSLQIAAFVDTPDRKERAVQAVRDARALGYEAYYYHGDTISSVCIGAWPRGAVREQEGGAVAHNNDPEQPVIVSNTRLPDEFVRKLQAQHLSVLEPRLELNDPTLAKAIEQFPEHAVNGAVMTSQGKDGKPVPAQSFLVIIPHKKLDEQQQDDVNNAVAPAPANPAVPADEGDPSLGKLRTIGDH